MFKLWKKDESKKGNDSASGLTWSKQAEQALEQAVAQSPVPKMVKGQVKKQLQQAAEDAAQGAGRTEVSPEDLMNGLMSKLPKDMRGQIENAAKQGPDGLKNLEKKLRRK